MKYFLSTFAFLILFFVFILTWITMICGVIEIISALSFLDFWSVLLGISMLVLPPVVAICLSYIIITLVSRILQWRERKEFSSYENSSVDLTDILSEMRKL